LALGFSRGLEPIPFDPAIHAARSGEERVADSAGCRSCHAQTYDNWAASRHRVSFTNEIYQESHSREPSAWCTNCHAPFIKPGGDPHRATDRVFAADGISCITCHVRDGRVITSRAPAVKGARPAHDYLVAPEFGDERLCQNCHQFNFLTIASSDPRARPVYSNLPMQNTVQEWRESGFYGKVTCAGCHVMAGTPDSHRFPGGHAIEDLAANLFVSAEYVDASALRLTVSMLGVGHAFPTGDLFRTLRVQIAAADGTPLHELALKKTYAYPDAAARRNEPESPARRLVADTTLPPPPRGFYFTERSFLIPVRSLTERLKIALYMDYLEPDNHALTRLPLHVTRPLIKRVEIPVEGYSEGRAERDAGAAQPSGPEG
jgi:nitrate/TMAO reductase-like tetraheme cytochrome c subunit